MKKSGFTLIELLIVVAIIAILAAIAVPNFLEAQIRSKVSRAKSDMRSIATAVESYAVDHNRYPIRYSGQPDRGGINGFARLSTPVAYLTSMELHDPFVPTKASGIPNPDDPRYNIKPYLVMVNIEHYRENRPDRGKNGAPAKYVLFSNGPDKVRGPRVDGNSGLESDYANDPARSGTDPNDKWFTTRQYDSTNGTRSKGDILRWPGGN